MNIKLFEPSGKVLNNPSYEYLEKVIYKADIDFWSSSDDISITFERSDGTVRLILIHSEKNNYFLEFIPPNLKVYDTFVSYNDSFDKEGVMCVYVGGEAHNLPSKIFVDTEKTCEALRYFLLKGGKSKSINWVKRSQISWPLSEDDDD